MASHSSVLAWRIPGTGKPGGLPSMGSHRVGHDWSNLAYLWESYWDHRTSDESSPWSSSIHYPLIIYYSLIICSTFIAYHLYANGIQTSVTLASRTFYLPNYAFIQQIPIEHLCVRPELDVGWSIRWNAWSNRVYILLGGEKQWITIFIHSLKINTMTSYSIAPYKCFQGNHPKRGRSCQEAELPFLIDWEINKVIHLIQMKSLEPNNACSKGGESGPIFWWETGQRFCW